jgi:hypothetical protein
MLPTAQQGSGLSLLRKGLQTFGTKRNGPMWSMQKVKKLIFNYEMSSSVFYSFQLQFIVFSHVVFDIFCLTNNYFFLELFSFTIPMLEKEKMLATQ